MTGVRYGVEAGVATLTLAEPETHNALSATLVDGLAEGLTRAAADEQARVVLLTHDGPTWCAGADLRAGGLTPRHDLAGVLTAIVELPKPVVARVAGPAVGGGVGLAAACDLTVVADDARFGFTEVRLGVAPAVISVVCLPKLRPSDARELMLSGRRFSGAHAAAVGLVTRAVPAAELDATVAELVGELLQGGPAALRATKALIARVPTLEPAAAYAEMSALSAGLFAGEEAAEGMAAFRERRPAAWVPEA